MLWLSLFVSFLGFTPAHAECGKPLKLCFYDDRYAESIHNTVIINKVCDAGAGNVIIKSSEDITAKLDELSQDSCNKIQSLIFLSHGANGTFYIRKEHVWREDDFKRIFKDGKYKKLLTPDFEMTFHGCDLGRSCKGRLSMFAAAQSIAKDRPIKIYAPNSKTGNLFVGITSRTGSINGSDLVFTQAPQKESWVFEGQSSGQAMSLAQSCKSECKEQLKVIQELKRKTHPKNCKNQSYAGIMQIFLVDVETLATQCAQAEVTPTWKAKQFFQETKLSLEDLEYLQYTVGSFQENMKKIDATCEEGKSPAIYPVLYKRIDQQEASEKFNKELPYFSTPAQ